MSDETETRVRVELAAFANVPVADVQARHLLREDLGLDSLDLVSLSMNLERTFAVEIGDGDIEELRTVGDLVALVRRLTETKQS